MIACVRFEPLLQLSPRTHRPKCMFVIRKDSRIYRDMIALSHSQGGLVYCLPLVSLARFRYIIIQCLLTFTFVRKKQVHSTLSSKLTSGLTNCNELKLRPLTSNHRCCYSPPSKYKLLAKRSTRWPTPLRI